MPNKASAKKALRQAKKRTELNRTRKEAFRSALKAALKATTLEEAKKLASLAQQALDKAARHNAIKKNTAARKLSRLMAKVNKAVKK